MNRDVLTASYLFVMAGWLIGFYSTHWLHITLPLIGVTVANVFTFKKIFYKSLDKWVARK